MAVRYGGSDEATLDLELNNDPQFASGSFIPEMGILDTLLAWNRVILHIQPSNWFRSGLRHSKMGNLLS